MKQVPSHSNWRFSRSGLFGAIAGATISFIGGPASAGTPQVPPDNPCARNSGNPCNLNNGNLGQQGNAGHERMTIDKKPPPIVIGIPAISRNAAYIDQVGDTNVATVSQTARVAYAEIDQDGGGNRTVLSQNGVGEAYASVSQKGSVNFAQVQQGGSGQNVLYLDQSGNSNWAWANQNSAGEVYNRARMSQSGNHNDMALVQDGSDNLADLKQVGDQNGMSATQVGDGNRLAWTQQGTGLTDLRIVQTGGMEKGGQLSVTQTGVTPGH